MKATGIVRRIDDLGRVVIPKEIRRTLRIKEGDPLEIYTDKDGEVIFKKYSPIGELGQFASQYAETLSKTCGFASVITDRDFVIAVSGVPKKELFEKKISDDFEDIMELRQNYKYKQGDVKKIAVVDGIDKYTAGLICPIIAQGDVLGAVCILLPEDGTALTEMEFKIAQSTAGFLSRHMES